MQHFKIANLPTPPWLHVLIILFLSWIPVCAAEPIDGFRELKFGMNPEEVNALPNCSTPHECMYELSNKNRYVKLTYGSDNSIQKSQPTETPRLQKISIDMGQYSEDWYKQLQVILGSSYRLTHDFTDETMNAFLAKQVEELQAGYEDGQVLLKVIRRQFGNMILEVIYQNAGLAEEYIRQKTTPQTTAP